MTAAVDSRVVRIVRWLVEQNAPRSTSELATDLGLSNRVVRYRLDAVDRYLTSFGAELSRQPGLGLSVIATTEVRAQILSDLEDRLQAPRVYSQDEREHLMTATLLAAAPDVVTLDQLTEELEVSKTSARRDLRRCEEWFESNELPLYRKPGKGLMVFGSERRIRRASVQLFLESIPPGVLDELTTVDFDDAQQVRTRVPAGLKDRIAELPLRVCYDAVTTSDLRLGEAAGNLDVVLAMYLAVSLNRISNGRFIKLDPGQFVSLVDHPASEAVASLVSAVAEEAGVELSPEEAAGITEYVLGLDALVAVDQPSADMDQAIDDLLRLAAQRLHPSLADDAALRSSLAMHVARLSVRLRHGLPVHNPLLAEVVERYPDVHVVAQELCANLAETFGSTISSDEVGFVTMYLSGAMERLQLQPQQRALVVCPSGMATAWVLVSRIQAEFPELSVVDVRSARRVNTAGGSAASASSSEEDPEVYDMIVSTVPLTDATVPVVVVTPLLSATDIQSVRSLLVDGATPRDEA